MRRPTSRSSSGSRPRRAALLAVVAASALGGCTPRRVPSPVPSPHPPSACVPAGRWVVPATARPTTMPAVVARAARARIVLLGEDHEVRDHHRWQTDVVAALAGRVATLRIGFEMFPRRVQPALDRWTAGALDEPHFLVESDWAHVWGADPTLYAPLFDFARIHRAPMIALNVDRTLVHRVAKDGWASVPEDAREGVSTPVPASARYRKRLAMAWRAHAASRSDDPAALDRFVEAQLVWDRAMAEAIRTALAARPRGIVVAVMGRGHVEHGDGVPAQLAALGAPRPVVLVPWNAERPCDELVPGLADAVFGVDEPESEPATAAES